MPITIENVRTLADWLGEDGASAGLDRSHLTVNELRELAAQTGKKLPSKTRRKDLVNEIVFGAIKRIDLPIDELMRLGAEDLLDYFETKRPSRSELLKILGELDFHPGSEAQKSLYKYAARQISETGMFQRVARKPPST
ncbi:MULTISPECIES: hypothetical protein [unclassified Mesorhizobium]|uniref:hypothetical protein n=1 Tax=unclassified Mesorhizobium TaxID=325217 RepID=UPI00333CD2E3